MASKSVFGTTLCSLKTRKQVDSHLVPIFVVKCIGRIESREDFLNTQGIYRVPADMETLKIIRNRVNAGNLEIIDTTEDIHILAGSLKLFFRELQSPLGMHVVTCICI